MPDGVRRAGVSPEISLCGFVHKNKNTLSFNCNKKSK